MNFDERLADQILTSGLQAFISKLEAAGLVAFDLKTTPYVPLELLRPAPASHVDLDPPSDLVGFKEALPGIEPVGCIDTSHFIQAIEFNP